MWFGWLCGLNYLRVDIFGYFKFDNGGVKEYWNYGYVYWYIDLFLDDFLYFISLWFV